MASFSNIKQFLRSSVTSASAASTSATSINSTKESDQPPAMRHYNCNLVNESMRNPIPTDTVQSVQSVPYDVETLPWNRDMPNPFGAIGSEYARAKTTSSRNSFGIFTTVPIMCFRCDNSLATTRCYECSSLFCYDCCRKIISECQLREHTLLPIFQQPPIGVTCNTNTNDIDIIFCEFHAEPVIFFCKRCTNLICQKCTLNFHKGHNHMTIKGTVDTWHTDMMKTIVDAKTGTKFIKTAIDRAMTVSKAYEKKSTEFAMQIRRNLHYHAGDYQNYILNKFESMRREQKKEFCENINILRDLLASLTYIIQTLVRSMDCKGLNLFMAKECGRSQVDHITFMFKNTYIPKDRLDIMPSDYELFNQFKVQCNLQSIAASSGVRINPDSVSQNIYQPLRSMQPAHAAQPYPTSSYIAVRGIGQAIPAYRMPVSLKPNRSSVPGRPIFSFGPDGQVEGRVSRPWGFCIDRVGNMIVADRRNNRIQIFSCGGDFRTMFGSKGTAPGEFNLPTGITTDVFDRIIVADKDNHRVQIFSMYGKFILKFGSFGKRNGQFRYPWDVATNTTGNIVVTDTLNHRIQLFTSEGRYITKFVFDRAHPTAMLKFTTMPRGVCFTTTGNIAVSDFQNHRLLIVDSTLSKVLYRKGRDDYGLRELDRPSGIVTDDEGHIIVADSKNYRLLIFNSELRLLATKYLKSLDLDDNDRPSNVALTPEGYLVVLFETRPTRDISLVGKHFIKVY
ncbi:unnamed protein product [Diatraea saccharalis]|uniref:B box-type domain-containing protein n=1 Tax=Diatraea saccharalis TaxID=40085 RepID=A0A9N9WLM9_9NEOP|nr:unnamed protein product [Diatraea saccharalis]